MKRKLYKSSKNKKLAGVCGGLAEYLNIDVTVVRLIWAILSLFYGSGIIIYIILTGIDRFVCKVPNYVYIPIAIIGVALIIIGFIKDKSKL